MDMTGGDVRTGRQKEVEREQLAAGLRAALANDDPLAADRIFDHMLRDRRLPIACDVRRFGCSTGVFRLGSFCSHRSSIVIYDLRQPLMLDHHACYLL
jgi:hypothetical protein